MPQDYVAVYFPSHSGYLCECVSRAAKDLADPTLIRQAVERGLRSADGQRLARAQFDDLLYATFGEEASELRRTLAQPLDRERAREVRGRIMRHGLEVCERWGAIVALSTVANLSTLAPRHWTAFALRPWLAAGLERHPALAPLDCPNCQQPVAALVTLSRLDSQNANWRIECSGCGYVDFNVPEPAADSDGYYSEESVRDWLLRSPAAASGFPASEARRKRALDGLRTVLQDLGRRLDEEVQESTGSLPAEWHNVRTIGAWQRYLFHLYPVDNLASVLTAPRHPVGVTPDLFWHTDIDLELEAIPIDRTVLLPQQPSHVAAHWLRAFNARAEALNRALSSNEAVDASLQALLLVEDCRRNGLLSPFILRVNP